MFNRSSDSYFMFQDVIRSQEHSITELLKAVSAQNDQMDHQREKIKVLEQKVAARDCT